MKKYILSLILFFLMGSVCLGAEVDPNARVKNGFVKTVARFEDVITKLSPKMNKEKVTRLATLIAIESKKTGIDPRVILAILKNESSFNQKAICKNKNGSIDVSIAQINTKAWTEKRFKQHIGKELNAKRLRSDEAYAISRMCMILTYLKKNFSKQDKWWFARYHSATPVHKKRYISELITTFKQLKPFGKDLLKDMPPIESLMKVRSSGNSTFALASYLEN